MTAGGKYKKGSNEILNIKEHVYISFEIKSLETKQRMDEWTNE